MKSNVETAQKWLADSGRIIPSQCANIQSVPVGHRSRAPIVSLPAERSRWRLSLSINVIGIPPSMSFVFHRRQRGPSGC